MCERWNEYFKLMDLRPELFSESSLINIETDINAIKKFEQETSKHIGVLYHSSYNMLIVDLIKDLNGRYYAYERIIPSSSGKAVVVLTKYMDKFVLLKQYRHAIRDYQMCFVRGFGENEFSAEENAVNEIKSEIKGDIRKIEYLGELSTDSGLTSNKVSYFMCEINSFECSEAHEGIDNIILIGQNEMEESIKNGGITDSFTVSAYCLYLLKK